MQSGALMKRAAFALVIACVSFFASVRAFAAVEPATNTRPSGSFATLYVHGRYNGTPSGWQAWGTTGTGPNAVKVNWDGKRYISTQLPTMISALDAHCTGVSFPCHLVCYSTGCLLAGRALAENPGRWNVLDMMSIAGASGGTELANLEWSIRSIPLFGAIVGALTDFFNLTFPEIDYDLRTSVARGMYNHNLTSGVPVKTLSGHWNVPAESCRWYQVACHVRNGGRWLVREAFGAIMGHDGHDGVLPYHTTAAFNGAVRARSSCPPSGYAYWTNYSSVHNNSGSCGRGLESVYHTDAATMLASAPSFPECTWVLSSVCQSTSVTWQPDFCYQGRVRQCEGLVTVYSPPADTTPSQTGNDTTAGAVSIAGGGLWKGNTSTMTNNYTATCGGSAGSNDAVYVVTVSQTTQFHADTWNSKYDTVLHLKKDSGSGAEIGCNDDGTDAAGAWSLQSSLDVTLQPGTYYLFVDGYSSYANGEYELHVAYGTPPNDNDVAANAVDISQTLGGTFTGSTSGRANDYGASCGGAAASADVVYVFTLSTTRTISADTIGSGYDTVLHIKSGSATGAEVACDDDSAGSLKSRVSVTLGAGTYYLFVDGYSSYASGSYTLHVTL